MRCIRLVLPTREHPCTISNIGIQHEPRTARLCDGLDFTHSGGICMLSRLTITPALVLMLCAVPAFAAEPAPSPTQAKYEIKFMTGMIDHHMMAVMMAQECVDKAVHEELRNMCEQIIAVQSTEIQEMQTWLSTWYGISYSPQMSNGMMKQMEKLSSMVGAEFEIEFMQSMIRHHWRAVIEGSQCIDKAYHQELVETCEDIVLTQTEEIRTLQSWLCDWYAICDYGPNI